MALKRLYTGEMVSLSGPWTQSDHADRAVLASIPATAALLPQLDQAHASLLSMQVKPESTPRLSVISKAQKRIDVRHDDVIRGLHGLIQSLAFLTPDPDLSMRLHHLLAVILPEGLDAVLKTYRDEAGQAALLESRLAPDEVQLLKRIKTLDGSAWDSVREWMTLASQLGVLEDERSGIKEAPGPAPADVVTARNTWIRTINAMRTVLDLVSNNEPGVQIILNRIAEAERKAEHRIASAEAAQVPSAPSASLTSAPYDDSETTLPGSFMTGMESPPSSLSPALSPRLDGEKVGG